MKCIWNAHWSNNFWYICQDWMESERSAEFFFGGWGISWKQNNRHTSMLILLLWEDLTFSWAFIREGMHITAQNLLFHNGMEIILKQCDLYLLVFKEAFNIRVFSELFQNLSHFLFFMCSLLSLNRIHKPPPPNIQTPTNTEGMRYICIGHLLSHRKFRASNLT